MDLFVYETYQDVRKNLFKYSIPVLVLAGFFCYFGILPQNHQQAINALLLKISQDPVLKNLLGTGIGVGILSCFAFVLTELIQIHDHWYDRYLIRWRHCFATDFILPRLIQPLAHLTNYRFHEEAEIHTGEFQECLFYPFVGDRDLKIPKNKLVRFYEVVTVYWLTQINEIVLILLAAVIGIYALKGSDDPMFLGRLLVNYIILAIIFLLNRIWVRKSLLKVRKATAEEIRAIHDVPDLMNQLKKNLKNLCGNYKIPFNEKNTDML